MCQAILLLLIDSRDTAFPGPSLHQCIPNQDSVNAYLPEVQLVVKSCPDIPGLAGAQCLSQDHMGEDDGSVGIPLPVEKLLPLSSQDCSKPVPHFPWGHGISTI